MNKLLGETSLLELLPDNLRRDPDIIAASKAADKSFTELVAAIKRDCLTFSGVANVREEVLNELAAEMQVDFYDPTLPITARRKMVENAYLYKYLKGTPFVVKRLVEDAFGAEGVTVEEWFEYGDEAGYFRLVTYSPLPDINDFDNLFAAIDLVKRKAAWVRQTLFAERDSDLPIHFGGAVHMGKYQLICQEGA